MRWLDRILRGFMNPQFELSDLSWMDRVVYRILEALIKLDPLHLLSGVGRVKSRRDGNARSVD